MISSKPAEAFLDHDHVEDLDKRIYIVVGNTHPPGFVVAYLKYVPTSAKTYWCRGPHCFERVIKRYGVSNVLSSVSGHQEELYDPSLGVSVPVVRVGRVLRVYRPRERFWEILGKPSDQVELDVIEAYEKVRRSASISPDSFGVDGSIAVGIQNPTISDVDIVIYGCREAIEVAETAGEVFERLPHEVEAERIMRMSEIYNLPLDVIRRISPPFKRLFMGARKREVNLMFCSGKPGRYGERVLVPIALVEANLIAEPGNCEALFYPGESYVEATVDVRVLGLLRRIDVDLSRISKIVNYESLYSYAIYRGGEMKVRGVASVEITTGDLVVTVGTREINSYAIPKKF